MGGKGRGVGAVLQGGLNARAAGQQYARQLEFERLALQKKASDASFGHSGRMIGLREKDLKNEKKMMGLTTALGLGMTGVNYLVGEQRAKTLAAERAKEKEWREEYSREQRRNNMIIQRLLSRGGRPYDNTTNFLRGGLQQ